MIVHSAAQAAQARALAPEVPIIIARMPPHLSPVRQDICAERAVVYWDAYLRAILP